MKCALWGFIVAALTIAGAMFLCYWRDRKRDEAASSSPMGSANRNSSMINKE